MFPRDRHPFLADRWILIPKIVTDDDHSEERFLYDCCPVLIEIRKNEVIIADDFDTRNSDLNKFASLFWWKRKFIERSWKRKYDELFHLFYWANGRVLITSLTCIFVVLFFLSAHFGIFGHVIIDSHFHYTRSCWKSRDSPDHTFILVNLQSAYTSGKIPQRCLQTNKQATPKAHQSLKHQGINGLIA